MKKLFTWSIAIVVMCIVTACGTQDELDASEEQLDEQASIPDFENEDAKAENEEDDLQLEEENLETEEKKLEPEEEIPEPVEVGSEPSDIKEIEVHVEGETELREAQFHRSDNDYGIYILDDFTFTGEEPLRDVIISNYDEAYFTRIISHTEGSNPDDIKENIIEHTVADIVEAPNQLEGADFVLREEYEEENGDKTVIYHAVKSYDNDKILQFTIFLPVREPIEGLAPSMWAMLNTIEW